MAQRRRRSATPVRRSHPTAAAPSAAPPAPAAARLPSIGRLPDAHAAAAATSATTAAVVTAQCILGETARALDARRLVDAGMRRCSTIPALGLLIQVLFV